MKFSVESFLDCQSPGQVRFDWEGRRYRSTGWYRLLRWMYTIEPIRFFTIKNEAGTVLERVEHELPD